MPKYDGNPNKDTCRPGRHPWPESRIYTNHGTKATCGECLKEYESKRKQPSKRVRPVVWNKAAGAKHNKRATLVEEYDFMISCGMSLNTIANTFGILPDSLETALRRSGRSKSKNWRE